MQGVNNRLRHHTELTSVPDCLSSLRLVFLINLCLLLHHCVSIYPQSQAAFTIDPAATSNHSTLGTQEQAKRLLVRYSVHSRCRTPSKRSLRRVVRGIRVLAILCASLLPATKRLLDCSTPAPGGAMHHHHTYFMLIGIC